jgi:hypothetical protein
MSACDPCPRGTFANKEGSTKCTLASKPVPKPASALLPAEIATRLAQAKDTRAAHAILVEHGRSLVEMTPAERSDLEIALVGHFGDAAAETLEGYIARATQPETML